MFQRKIKEKIINNLFKGKVICIFGPRRSGKTTICKEILAPFGDDGYYLNCENIVERGYLVEGNPSLLKSKFGDKKIIVLDEAQSVEYIGKFLKLFVDTYPEIQLIATGSSSFELANKVGEPLVGRAYEHFLPPLAFSEIKEKTGNFLEMHRIQDELLIYGSYPQVVSSLGEEKKEVLSQIVSSYLYKDILTFENIKKPRLIESLLRLLALQIGQEVSVNDLAQRLEVTRATILRYIDLLEKVFIIKVLYPLRRNRRDEVRNLFKVYFWDLGVRNFLLERLQPLELRDDKGMLFENFFVMEMLKKFYQTSFYLPPLYFWRIYKDQLEVDFLYEKNGKFFAYECKWNEKETPKFTKFLESYPNSETFIVNRDNFQDYL